MREPVQSAKSPSRPSWETYKRLLSYTRPYMARLVIGGVCGAIFAGSSVGFLPALNKTLLKVFDFNKTTLTVVLFIGMLLPLLAIIRGIGAFASSYLIQWVGNRVVMDLRARAFTHLQDLSVAYFDQNRTGEMISRTVNDTALLERAVSTALTDVVRQPLVLVGAVLYLFLMDWQLALVSFVVFPVCMYPIVIYGRKVRKAARQAQEHMADIVSIMQEAIVGVRIVKAFCMEKHEETRFVEHCGRFFGRTMRVVRSKSVIEPLIVFISSLGMVLALLYAFSVRMPFQDFITFAVALVLMYDPVKKISSLHLVIQHGSAAADRVFDVLDTKVSVENRPGASDFDEEIREIALEDVHFSYGSEPVLRGISLKVKAGERIAFVGSSGAGKTTLVNLIPRFFDPASGRMLVNGKDVRDITMKSLRSRIGLVTQETFLFNDTIAWNISYGSADTSREAVVGAARKAHADDFISAMPGGYDSVIGERGVRLSGGQRQRLAIARAIMKDPPILILDEATNALDTESERAVQAALDDLVRGRTVFAIAHRLSTIVHCDRIIVLDKGRIVEQGTHNELLSAGGVYKRLYDLQFELKAPDTGEQNIAGPASPAVVEDAL
ncbi:MAG: hypothetical protein C0404_05450 [Verrucomicrobia bacterium]|nr:hypothetical protein [Verrucomicrobiota bacterium]